MQKTGEFPDFQIQRSLHEILLTSTAPETLLENIKNIVEPLKSALERNVNAITVLFADVKTLIALVNQEKKQKKQNLSNLFMERRMSLFESWERAKPQELKMRQWIQLLDRPLKICWANFDTLTKPQQKLLRDYTVVLVKCQEHNYSYQKHSSSFKQKLTELCIMLDQNNGAPLGFFQKLLIGYLSPTRIRPELDQPLELDHIPATPMSLFSSRFGTYS